MQLGVEAINNNNLVTEVFYHLCVRHTFPFGGEASRKFPSPYISLNMCEIKQAPEVQQQLKWTSVGINVSISLRNIEGKLDVHERFQATIINFTSTEILLLPLCKCTQQDKMSISSPRIVL